jgi:hypothetical protein
VPHFRGVTRASDSCMRPLMNRAFWAGVMNSVTAGLREISRRRVTVFVLLALAACSAGDRSQSVPQENVGESRAALCTATTFTPSVASPLPLNATVRLTASASCGTASPEYLFMWQMGGSAATTSGYINDWSPSNFVDWNTTGLPSGNYNLYAFSRSSGGHAV